MDWTKYALCRGIPVNKFFLPKGGNIPSEIRALCESCPVRTDCLEDVVNSPFKDYNGIRAGTTETDRRPLKRERAFK